MTTPKYLGGSVVTDADPIAVALTGGDATTAIGATDDAAWDGQAADATVIALLKRACALLDDIKTNTTPTP